MQRACKSTNGDSKGALGLSAWQGEDGTHVTAFAHLVTMKRHWRAISHKWEEGEAQSEQDCCLEYKTLSIRAM